VLLAIQQAEVEASVADMGGLEGCNQATNGVNPVWYRQHMKYEQFNKPFNAMILQSLR
jgi:hypothetical protein